MLIHYPKYRFVLFESCIVHRLSHTSENMSIPPFLFPLLALSNQHIHVIMVCLVCMPAKLVAYECIFGV